MSKTIFVHSNQAFTNEEALFEMTGAIPDKAGRFTYRGKMPKTLFRVEGPGVDFISADMRRALAALVTGAGHRLTAISTFWS